MALASRPVPRNASADVHSRVWGTPGQAPTRPSSSCMTDRAPRSCRCRTEHRQQRGGPHGRRSGRWLDAPCADSWAPVTALATPGTQHAGAQPLPGPRAGQGVVPAAVGLPGVPGAAATRAAGDDTTYRAELHPESSEEWLARSIRSRCFAWGVNPQSAPGAGGPFDSRQIRDQRLGSPPAGGCDTRSIPWPPGTAPSHWRDRPAASVPGERTWADATSVASCWSA